MICIDIKYMKKNHNKYKIIIENRMKITNNISIIPTSQKNRLYKYVNQSNTKHFDNNSNPNHGISICILECSLILIGDAFVISLLKQT